MGCADRKRRTDQGGKVVRSKDKHYHDLTQTWADVDYQIRNGHAPNLVDMRELVIELREFRQKYHDESKWITDKTLSNLQHWFDLRIKSDPPETSGLKDRRESDYDLTRYWLVRDLVAAGVSGRKSGDSPMIACEKAAAILRYLDHPAGRARGGVGNWVTARTIKESCRRAADKPDQWALEDDDFPRIEVSSGLIEAVSE